MHASIGRALSFAETHSCSYLQGVYYKASTSYSCGDTDLNRTRLNAGGYPASIIVSTANDLFHCRPEKYSMLELSGVGALDIY